MKVDHYQSPAVRDLCKRLSTSGRPVPDIDAATVYGMTWAVVGRLVFVLLSLAISALVSIALASALGFDTANNNGQSWIWTLAWMGIFAALVGSTSNLGATLGARLQMKRLGIDRDRSIPPAGWLAISGDDLLIWKVRGLLLFRLSDAPAMRMPIDGWSLEVVRSALGNPRVVTLHTPEGTAIPIGLHRLGDTMKILRLLDHNVPTRVDSTSEPEATPGRPG